MSTSSPSDSICGVFVLIALLARPSLSDMAERVPLSRLTGSLRPTSGVGLRVSMPSSEFSLSSRRLFDRIGVREAKVDGVKWGLVIPNPKLSEGGG
jgi:hypothetical protein